MGDGEGDEAGGLIHVHIGLSGKGEIEAGVAKETLEPGAEDGLGLPVGEGQRGIDLTQVIIDRRALLEALAQGLGEGQVAVSGDLRGKPGSLDSEVGRHLQKLLRGVGILMQAVFFRKAGGVVSTVPRPAEDGPQPRQRAAKGYDSFQEGLSLPLFCKQQKGSREPQDTPCEEQGDKELPHGEGEQAPEGAYALHGGCHELVYPGVHEGGVGFESVKKEREEEGSQKK